MGNTTSDKHRIDHWVKLIGSKSISNNAEYFLRCCDYRIIPYVFEELGKFTKMGYLKNKIDKLIVEMVVDFLESQGIIKRVGYHQVYTLS